MKNQVLALSLGLLTAITFGQKKELRVAEKALKKNQFSVALSAVNSVEGMLETMDSKYKSKYYFLKAQAFAGESNYAAAANSFNDLFDFEKEVGSNKYSKEAKPMLNALIQKVSEKYQKLDPYKIRFIIN